VSDFAAVGDFSFSVDGVFSDNDTLEIIWEFEDLSNHYRMSWARNFGESGTGSTTTGFEGIFDGLKIVRGVAGVSSVLFSSDIEDTQNLTYNMPGRKRRNGVRSVDHARCFDDLRSHNH
jgi:hypothetical protein